jgi:hypothetical protein
LCTQAAYNNTSEIELEASDVYAVEEPSELLFPMGTKIAKQFDGADGKLDWFEGEVQRYDKQDELYWILYGDGDSEDMDASEVREAMDNFRVHLQPQEEAGSEAETTAVGSILLSASAVTDEATVLLTADEAVPAIAVPLADTDSVQSSDILSPSELAVAVQAMTAAVERLSSAATRIEATVQTQHARWFPQPRIQQQQQQQWQQQLQWQQQQHYLAYYQQQQWLNWQQWQRW